MAKETTYVLEIPFRIKENYPQVLKDYWGKDNIKDPLSFFKKAQEKALFLNLQYLSFYLNIEEESEIDDCIKIVKEIDKISKIPLIIRGSGQKNIDAKLLPQIAPLVKKTSTIGCVQEANYKDIVEKALDHTLILRTPIDINLTKELNILSSDAGLPLNQILIDPDMGCVGYGLDYGYSIIERIKLASDSDKMLNMPIIVFAGEESYRAKETKSDDFKPSWGKLETRSNSWEISTAEALICAGADIVVLWHPRTIEILREVYNA